MGKQADTESANLKEAVGSCYSMISIVMAYKQTVPRDLEMIKNRIPYPTVFRGIMFNITEEPFLAYSLK